MDNYLWLTRGAEAAVIQNFAATLLKVAAAQVLMHGQAPFTRCERCTKVRKFVNPRIGGNSCPASEQA